MIGIAVRSKLTDEQVSEIRHRSAAGDSIRKLAVAYGVSHAHIGRIVRGVARGTKKAE